MWMPGVKPMLRDREKPTQQPYERQAENKEQRVPDVEARDQAPDEVGVALKQQRTGAQTVLLERGEHDGRSDEVGRPRARSGASAPAEEALWSFGAGGTLDSSLAELFRMFREPFFQRVGQDGRNLVPPADVPMGKQMAVPRRHGFHDLAQSSALIQSEHLIA